MADVLSRRPTDFVGDEMERMMRRFLAPAGRYSPHR